MRAGPSHTRVASGLLALPRHVSCCCARACAGLQVQLGTSRARAYAAPPPSGLRATGEALVKQRRAHAMVDALRNRG